jgi:hypothetical protein
MDDDGDGDGDDEADASSTDADETGALAEDTGVISCVAGIGDGDGDADGDDGSMTCAIANAPNRHAIPTIARHFHKL